MSEKLYYSMGEVAEMFDVNQSLIRHWESQFSVIRPKRNKKGNRLFTPQDVEYLKLIYHLVKERGMTLEGAKKALRQHKADSSMSRDAELMERLQRVRSLLAEVREDLGADDKKGISVGAGEDASELPKTPRKSGKAVVKITEESDSQTTSDAGEKGLAKAPRNPRRKRGEEDKELFAFFEQRLF